MLVLAVLAIASVTAGCLRTGMNTGADSAPETTPLSPLDIIASNDGTRLYIAEYTRKRVVEFDTASKTILRGFELPDAPTGLALSSDGSRLYITAGVSKGYVKVIDLPTGKTVTEYRTGHSPCAPVVSPDGGTLYVMNRFANTMSLIETATGRTVRKFTVLREPFAAKITPDGRYLYIANRLPTGDRIYDYVTDGGILMIGSYISTGYFSGTRESYAVTGVVLVFDTYYKRFVELIPLPNGSTTLNDLALSPDGRYAYVTHVLSRYQLPTSQLDRGWVATNAVSVIDVKRMKLFATIPLDDIDRGAANPWGVACSPDGSKLFVAHGGLPEISVIDRLKLHERLSETAQGDTVSASATIADVTDDLSFLSGIRERIATGGNGPRKIALAGDAAFYTEYFSDTLGVIEYDSGGARLKETVRLGPDIPLSEARKGEMYFSDARLCYQEWLSCTTCHPDGRSDGINWDLLNDGIGNPKNTKSLLYSHKTPPVMITGIRKDAETAVRAGFHHIQFAATDESVASAVDAYLKSLEPVPSPYLENGVPGEGAKRGEKAFIKAGCAECHPAPLFTDLKSYDVGTGLGLDEHTPFDTPTLVEVWRTKPYLFDGRADSMFDLLKTYNKHNLHGETSRLEAVELGDLVDYVLTR